MLTYRGYHANVQYDDEDSILVGKVIGLADSLNFHAKTADEVEPMFHQCVDGYLDFCAEMGKTPEKAYKGSFNVRISPELHREAELAAAKQDISLNEYVRRAIEHEVREIRSTVVCLPATESTYRIKGLSAQAYFKSPELLLRSGKERVGTWNSLEN